MKIVRKTYSSRDAYIEGYKDGAREILRDSLEEAVKTPVRYNGKAIKKMLDYTEKMEDKIPEMAIESAGEEKTYSENLQGRMEEIISHLDTMKIGKLAVISDQSGDDEVCISGGLNGRGTWSSYFETLSKFMFQVELRFPDAYVVKLVNDTLDDVFYLTVRIPKDEEQREFGDKEVPKRGNKSPGDREIVPDYIVKKVMNGEGVIHYYKGSWRIVSMKTNPPTFWDAHYKTEESARKALSNYHSRKG